MSNEDIEKIQGQILFHKSELKKLGKISQRLRLSETLLRKVGLGEQVGRPRIANRDEVIALRQTGLSISQVAEKLNISKGSAQYNIQEHRRLQVKNEY